MNEHRSSLHRVLATLLGLAALGACAGGAEDPPPGGDAGAGAGNAASGGASSASGGHGGAGEAGAGDGGAPPIACGNGVAEPGEDCDGDDHGGKSCTDYGYAGGELGCNATCHAIGKDCVPFETCGDDKDNDRDELLDCDDPECVQALVCVDPCSSFLQSDGYEYVDFGLAAGNSTALVSSCSEPGDRVSVVKVVVAGEGDLRLRTASSNLALRAECSEPASEIACEQPSLEPPTPSSLIRIAHVLPGEVYWVLVHSAEGEEPSLVLTLIDWEEVCDDLLDGDYDGLTDCEDDDCANERACEVMP